MKATIGCLFYVLALQATQSRFKSLLCIIRLLGDIFQPAAVVGILIEEVPLA